jgi:hypothetical protein
MRSSFADSLFLRFDDFDAITERVLDVAVRFSVKRKRVRGNHDADICEMLEQTCIVRASKRRVRLLCRNEVRIDAEMEAYTSASKPSPSSFCKFFGFRNLFEPQSVRIELAGAIFVAGRHGQLYVI